jgi:hypothetical protein
MDRTEAVARGEHKLPGPTREIGAPPRQVAVRWPVVTIANEAAAPRTPIASHRHRGPGLRLSVSIASSF